MKTRLTLILTLILLTAGTAMTSADDGTPLVANYLPEAYHAHHRNFDVMGDSEGRVYVANFEGLLCYDQAEWRIIRTPGVARITTFYQATDGRIWVGGYNIFGYLTTGTHGELELKTIYSVDNKGFLGEIIDITEKDGKIWLETSNGDGYLEDHSMDDFVITKAKTRTTAHYNGMVVNDSLRLSDGSKLLALQGGGLVCTDPHGTERYRLTESNGLSNNNVNALYADTQGFVWGATDNGVFLLDTESPFTRFSEAEGLPGEVQSISHTSRGLYVGTLRGLFRMEGKTFHPVEGISQACWQITLADDSTLYASTSDGLFAITGDKARRITSHPALSTYADDKGGYYTAEPNGTYYNKGNTRRQHNDIEKATMLLRDANGILWARNIYGQVFQWYDDSPDFKTMKVKGKDGEEIMYNNTLFVHDSKVHQLNKAGIFVWNQTQHAMVADTGYSLWSTESQYPKFVYVDHQNRVWLTNNEGKGLRVYVGEGQGQELNAEIHPLSTFTIQAMEVHGQDVWLGGLFGVIHQETKAETAAAAKRTPRLYIRRLAINHDSLLWGGYATETEAHDTPPYDNLEFNSGTWRIRVTFSLNTPTTVGETLYRYRLNENKVSTWSTQTSVNLDNLSPGDYTLRIEARDCHNKEVEPVEIHFSILPPFYLRWYAIVAYILLLAGGIYLYIRWRLRHLRKEKEALKDIVAKRTKEIRRQKDEIEEKSRCLEQTLQDLHKAQFQLIRQKNLATIGTLTKGLVDRILNPMNYINNFSHLSISLVKDLNENLEADKDKMTPDTYDDSVDVLGMLKGNLQKIEEHGVNTSRVLKAMEEMLKDRSSHPTLGDLAAICRKSVEVASTYFKREIEDCHITIEQPDERQQAMAEADMEQLSKVVTNMLANSIYAVRKKYQQKAYQPVVSLSVRTEPREDMAYITLRDNGTGIEEAIQDKIFDPFFTTKTTAEATGIGMYLSREYILNHHGDITVKSVKNEYTEFTIALPIHQGKEAETTTTDNTQHE